jgi:signal transduction histidine kinase
MFDAALAQLFLLSTPLDIGDLPKQGVAERLRGTTLRAVAQFLQSQDGIPRHFAGRILKSSPEKRPDIVVGNRKGLTESVLTSLAHVVSSDVESDPFWSNTPLELTGCRSFVGVPLLADTGKGKALYGVLTMTRLRMDKDDSRAFDVDEVYAVQNVAALIVAALVKAKQVELAEAEAERALANEREVQERVGRCLKWFRHDIPGFIAYLEDVVQQHVREKATPERVLRVANGIRAVYMACAAGLGEVQPGSHQLRKYGLSVDITEIEVQVQELLKSDWHGKTVVHPFKVVGPKVVDGVSPLALTYVTYALVHNALIACDYNRSVTEPTLPGNVWVEWTSGDGWLELSVADDGGGLRGASWEEMSRESHTMWSAARGIQRNEEPHFGMGLYIVRRLIEGCADGTVEARDVEHNDGQRVGARFLARVPTGMVSLSESVPEVVGDSQDVGQ